MKTLLHLVLLFGAFSAYAQEEFSFQLYFEDAAGNRDTVTVGYDANSTNGIDTGFSEENIASQPWSETFEVRVGNAYLGEETWPLHDNIMDMQTKKQIKFKDCTMGFMYGIPLIVKTQHDFIIRWDTIPDLFTGNQCVENSLIKLGTRFINDIFVYEKRLRNQYSNPNEKNGIFDFFTLNDIELRLPDFLFPDYYVIWIHLGSKMDWAGETIGINEIKKEKTTDCYLITDNTTSIQLPNTISEYQILNNTGQILFSAKAEEGIISIPKLTNGVYYIHSTDNNGNISIARVLKQ